MSRVNYTLNIEDIMNKIVTKTTEIIEDYSTDTSDELTGKNNDLNIPVDKCLIIKEIFKSFNSLKANMSFYSPDALPDLYKLISKVLNMTIKEKCRQSKITKYLKEAQ